MSPREMRLVIVLGVILGVGGVGLLGYQWFYKPLQDYNRTIARLKGEISTKSEDLAATLQERKLLDRARLMSLSPTLEAAQGEFGGILNKIFYDSGLEMESFAPTLDQNEGKAGGQQQTLKPGHKVVTFQVRAKGELAQLVHAMQELKTTPIIQRIRSLDITRQDTAKSTTDRLIINMRLDAMIVGRAEPHADGPLAPDLRLITMETMLALRRGPTGLGLLPWIIGPTGPSARNLLAMESGYRQYREMALKNIFRGGELPPRDESEDEEDPIPTFDVTEYVRLDTTDPDNREAYLRNLVFKTKPIRVRHSHFSSSGFDTFRIYSGELKTHTLVTGKVLRIEQRDMYFQVLDEIYCIHLGQSLHDAMWRSVSDSVLERLNLKVDEKWAAQQKVEHAQQMAALKAKGNPKKDRKGR